MSDLKQEIALLQALRDAFVANKRNCSAHGDRPAGVLVLWEDHLRGIWYSRDGMLEFTPGGYASSTYRCETIEAAVTYTLAYVCR